MVPSGISLTGNTFPTLKVAVGVNVRKVQGNGKSMSWKETVRRVVESCMRESERDRGEGVVDEGAV
jgi:hypothetical protein